MVVLDEKLSRENRNQIYKLIHNDYAATVIEFKKRVVDNDKVCYVAIVEQDNKYYMFGAKYMEEFIGFEISKSDINLSKNLFRIYEIEKLIRFSRVDYKKIES